MKLEVFDLREHIKYNGYMGPGGFEIEFADGEKRKFNWVEMDIASSNSCIVDDGESRYVIDKMRNMGRGHFGSFSDSLFKKTLYIIIGGNGVCGYMTPYLQDIQSDDVESSIKMSKYFLSFSDGSIGLEDIPRELFKDDGFRNAIKGEIKSRFIYTLSKVENLTPEIQKELKTELAKMLELLNIKSKTEQKAKEDFKNSTFEEFCL